MDLNLESEPYSSSSSSGYQSSGTDCSQPDGAVCRQQPYRCLSVLPGHEGHVFSLALASDQLVYSGSDRGELRASRWTDTTSGGTQFGSGEGSVKAMVVVEDKLFTAHQDQRIRVWKRSSGRGHKLVATLPTMKDYVMTYITPKSSVRVRRHKRAPWIDHHDTISVLAVGKGVLYSGSWDKTIKVWRFSDLKCIESIPAHIDAVNALAVDTTRGFLYSGSADGTVKVWERMGSVTAAKPKHRHRHSSIATLASPKHQSVTALALTPDGTICYAGSSDKCIAVWHRHDEGTRDHMQNISVLRGHHLAVLCLASASNHVLVSGSADKTIRIWKRDAELAHQCVSVLHGHARPVKCLAAALEPVNRGFMVYSGSMDRSVRVWWVSLLEADADSAIASAISPSSPDVEFLTSLDSPFGLNPAFRSGQLL